MGGASSNDLKKGVGAARSGGVSKHGLAINLAAVADLDNDNNEDAVLDPRDDAEVSDAIPPKAGEIARQGVTQLPRVVCRENSTVQIVTYSLAIGGTQLEQLPSGAIVELEPPACHAAAPSSRSSLSISALTSSQLKRLPGFFSRSTAR